MLITTPLREKHLRNTMPSSCPTSLGELLRNVDITLTTLGGVASTSIYTPECNDYTRGPTTGHSTNTSQNCSVIDIRSSGSFRARTELQVIMDNKAFPLLLV